MRKEEEDTDLDTAALEESHGEPNIVTLGPTVQEKLLRERAARADGERDAHPRDIKLHLHRHIVQRWNSLKPTFCRRRDADEREFRLQRVLLRLLTRAHLWGMTSVVSSQ